MSLFLKTFYKKIRPERLYTLLLVVILLPLFYINVRDSHDWGGDFSMYIMQARNVIEWIPQSLNLYVLNVEYLFIGPKCYSVGFPLLLAPVFAFLGNDMYAFQLYISFFLFITAILAFVLFTKFMRPLAAFCLTLIMFYNPWVLSFKSEVMSDIPFSLFLLLSTMLYISEKKNFILIVLVSGFMICIRDIGIVFPLVVAINGIRIYICNRIKGISFNNAIKDLLKTILLACVIIVFSWLLNRKVFHTTTTLTHYASLFHSSDIIKLILNNVSYYTDVFKTFFTINMGLFRFVPIIVSASFLTFIIIGFVKRIIKKVQFIDMVFVGFLIVYFIYPYQRSGFRFLFPLLPFMMVYAAVGFKSIDWGIKINTHLLIVFLTVIVFFEYSASIMLIIKKQNTIVKGPQEIEAQEAFAQVQSCVPINEIVVFSKPRVLAFYTGRRSFMNNPHADTVSLKKQFSDLNITYFLTYSDPEFDEEMGNLALVNYITTQRTRIDTLFMNSKFCLMRYR